MDSSLPVFLYLSGCFSDPRRSFRLLNLLFELKIISEIRLNPDKKSLNNFISLDSDKLYNPIIKTIQYV